MSDTTRLDAVAFDALHLAALESGGIGYGRMRRGGEPWCAYGLAEWVDLDGGNAGEKLIRCCFSAMDGDARMEAAGVKGSRRVSFERWCKIVGVDVAE